MSFKTGVFNQQFANAVLEVHTVCRGVPRRMPDALSDGAVFIRQQHLEGTLLADGNNLFYLVQTYNYDSLGKFRGQSMFCHLTSR